MTRKLCSIITVAIFAPPFTTFRIPRKAGLAWIAILRKRENFRSAFNGFDPDDIAGWGETDMERLLVDQGIVRHRGKIEATVGNTRAWQKIKQNQRFDRFVWDCVDGVPVQNTPASMADVPAATPLSTVLSKDLKKAGFRFCGPAIVYAWLQGSTITLCLVRGMMR